MRNNMGVSMDNTESPKPPSLLPPYTIFVPWLFEVRPICIFTGQGSTVWLPLTLASNDKFDQGQLPWSKFYKKKIQFKKSNLKTKQTKNSLF